MIGIRKLECGSGKREVGSGNAEVGKVESGRRNFEAKSSKLKAQS
jgi:hypothetical protein